MPAEPRIPLSEFQLSFARSSGPGGQNVNKVNSKCILKWNLAESSVVNAEVRARFLAAYGNRVSQEGNLVISSDTFRDQKQNRDACVRRAEALLASVLHPPKKRRHTKPTKGSKARRMDAKTKHGVKKILRGKSWD